MSDALDAPRSVLRDLHRTALLRDDKHTSSELADQFADIALGLEDLQTREVLRAVFRSWATREGADIKRSAIREINADGIALLVRYARNGQSGTKPLRLFTLNETQNTRIFYQSTAREYAHQEQLWSAAEAKHSQHPELPLGDVLDPSELQALADASLEAEAV